MTGMLTCRLLLPALWLRCTNERKQRSQVRIFEVGPRHLWSQGDTAPVDPGDAQAKRPGANHVGQLGLPGVQDCLASDTGVRQQVAEQGAIGLVATGALGRTDQVEGSLERRGCEQIVVDIGDKRELEPA